MLIDLSHHLDNATQIYPGDPQFTCCPALSLEEDGFQVTAISLGTHTGTHVDAPSHSVKASPTITDLDLALFQGQALVIDVRGKQPREKITWDGDLKPYRDRMETGVIVVIYTGWSAFWQSPAYLDHPFLDATAAEGLVQAGIRTVALDCMSPDETVPEGQAHSGSFVAHHIILSRGGVIAENLTHLSAIADGKAYMVSLLPLKLTGLDGSPVRAVAWQM